MSDIPDFRITGRWIKSSRGRKNPADPRRPYAWMVEKERTESGEIKETAVIFLTNRECPYSCLMCDLWKNTTDKPVSPGCIPEQIEWALGRLPAASRLKLYNSGSFFDEKAIPACDYKTIASLISGFETVVVESHPRFIDSRCLRFRDMLKPELQVAIGLETVHPEVLKKLNKQMTPGDFRKSAGFLKENKIKFRTFILLKPPFLSEENGIYWAERSVDFAFDAGATVCIIIPVRPGNGALETLMEKGLFKPPDVRSLEMVLEYGIKLNRGLVFADLWDLRLFSDCDRCIGERINRLNEMNLSQKITCRVECTCDTLQ